jgi:hypothetical protein
MNKNTLQGQIVIPLAHFFYLLPDDTAGSIAKELWWTNKEFSSAIIIIPPWLSLCGMNNRPVGGCSSET